MERPLKKSSVRADCPNGVTANMKSLFQFSRLPAVASQLPNFLSLSLGQFCVCRSFTKRVLSAVVSISDCVQHVLSLSSRVKVFRVQAKAVSVWAFVQYVVPFGYRSTVENPTRAVRTDHPALSAVFLNVPVSGPCSAFRPNPKPAAFSLLHFGPKSFEECFVQTLRSKVLESNFDHSSVSCPSALRTRRAFSLCHHQPIFQA